MLLRSGLWRLSPSSLYTYSECKSCHGHKVSNRAYLFHYFVKDKTDPSIEVKFDSHVDLVKISPTRLERKLKEMVKLLNGKYPGHNPDCEKCCFYVGRQRKVRK